VTQACQDASLGASAQHKLSQLFDHFMRGGAQITLRVAATQAFHKRSGTLLPRLKLPVATVGGAMPEQTGLP